MPTVMAAPCRNTNIIVLRPKDFQRHNVQFLIHCSPATAPPKAAGAHGSSTASTFSCWRVPHHLTAKPWLSLLKQKQHAQQLRAAQLVLLQHNPALDVLKKFERRGYIHAYVPACSAAATCKVNASNSSDGTSNTNWLMRFELPRFGLEFEVQHDGQILSRDRKGFRLSSCQQLVWEARNVDATTASAPAMSVTSGSCGSGSASASSMYTLSTAVSATTPGSAPGTSSSTTNASSDGRGTGRQGVARAASNAAAAVTVHYTLPELSQYLVLERVPHCCTSSNSSSTGLHVDRMVMVPAGPVVLDQSGRPSIQLSRSAAARIQVSCISCGCA